MPETKSCLVFLATYNEAENVREVFGRVRREVPEADVLFIDDNSPDGTGQIIDDIVARFERVHVIHRLGKQGIGSAHQEALNWAYDHRYEFVITMDCDLAHSPEYLPVFLGVDTNVGVVVGTRFEEEKSLPGWNLFRRILTHLGHFLTRSLLGMTYDATGALRRYNLSIVPRRFLDLLDAPGYSFFFESLHLLFCNGIRIEEIPIELPARTYGSSKMRLADMFGGFATLLRVGARARFRRSAFMLEDPVDNSPESWNRYWREKHDAKISAVYDRIAEFYRNHIIRPSLNRCIRRFMPKGSSLLHAGCGGGAVDMDVVQECQVTALDFSSAALESYRSLHGASVVVAQADLMDTGFPDATFDGIYNLGVMEHFVGPEIDAVLGEFRRILKPDGRLMLFWPPEYGMSVIFLKFVHFVLNDLLGRNIQLHPAEPSRVRSRKWVEALLSRHGFALDSYLFGPRDAFTYSVVVAQRVDNFSNGGSRQSADFPVDTQA